VEANAESELSVSVVIAAFNVEGAIERAISSLRDQTAPPIEVIVVDDASTDGTRDVVRRMQTSWPAIRLVELPDNRGPSGARNVGIETASGDWVAILDADDCFKPDRLEILTRLGEEKNADFVADNLITFDEAAGVEGGAAFEVEWQLKCISPFDVIDTSIPEAREFSYGLLKPLLRRTYLNRTGLRYDEATRYGEDVQFYAELLFNGARAWVSSQPLYVYTTRVGEISKKSNKFSRSMPRFDLMAEVNDRFSEKYPDQIDARFRRSLQKRSVRLREIHQANVARVHRKAGHFWKYTKCVLTHPGLLRLLLMRTGRRALALAAATSRRR